MTFFDLNIPYTESNKPNSTTDKSTRLKLAVKAMELGYTGVAYNRTITGVMSELDRCSISLFPMSSVLKVSPSISTSVNLHRRLLNVATASPFRQYTRLTVVVDTPAQGSALNSGNPVLKTYDIVAVRPLKQESFDQACKNYEVDIIAIDFSENRFRLKQPLIKAAIERGVYFEITYSGLLMDAQLRRQMIFNAKLLVDWTRGKNLIFSSGAPSVTELRGPYDVANLACLLGFSNERSKASVSRTCRSLLENSLRKKKFYKEAIKIELISSSEQTDSFDDWLKWDPISSGDGDLQFDDMAKSFAATNKESKTVKPIDFVSIIDELPSDGLHITYIITETKLDSELHDQPKNDQSLATEILEKRNSLNFGDNDLSLANENLEDLDSVKVGETRDMIIEQEIEIPSDSNVRFSENKNPLSEFHEPKYEDNVTNAKEGVNICREEFMEGGHVSNIGYDVAASRVTSLNKDVLEECSSVMAEDVSVVHAPNEVEVDFKVYSQTNHVYAQECSSEFMEGGHISDTGDDVAATPVISSNADVLEGHPSVMVEDVSVVHEPNEVKVEFKDRSQTNHMYAHESSSERVKRKGNSRRSVSFPFKRLLKPSHFKKARKFKTKSMILSLSNLIG